MPKKTKVLTRTLYTYVEPINRMFAIRQAKKEKIEGGYSGYINHLLASARHRIEGHKKPAPTARTGNNGKYSRKKLSSTSVRGTRRKGMVGRKRNVA